MSKEQLKTFLEKIKGDLNLQERLKAAKSQDDVVSIAKEHGYEFESEHISQLSEEQMEGFAGGMNSAKWFPCGPSFGNVGLVGETNCTTGIC